MDYCRSAPIYAIIYSISTSFFGVQVPSVIRVLKSKRAVYDVYLQVPLFVVRALRARVAQRIASAARAEEDEGNGIDIMGDSGWGDAQGIGVTSRLNSSDSEEDLGGLLIARVASGDGEIATAALGGQLEDDPLAAAINTLKNQRRGVSAAGLGDDGDSGSGGHRGGGVRLLHACCRRHRGRVHASSSSTSVTSSTKHNHTHKARYYTHASSQRAAIFAAMMWPIVLYAAYFSGVWYWKTSVVDYSRWVRAEVLWSAQVDALTPQIASGMRRMLSYKEAGLVNWQLSRSYAQLVFYDFIISALAYGDADRHLRPGLQDSESTFDLYLKDGCVENAGYYYRLEDCRHTFQNGLLSDGLLAAAREYTLKARMVFDARKAELAANPRGPLTSVSVESGTPYEVNQLGLNFLAAGFSASSRDRLNEAVQLLSDFGCVRHDCVAHLEYLANGLRFIYRY